MGSLAVVFNARSALVTADIHQQLNPAASQERIVKVGRTAMIVMVVIALAWLPVIRGAHGLHDYLQSGQDGLAPPVFVMFFLGVFWKRMNRQGYFWAMITGFAIGLFRRGVDTPVSLLLAGFEHGYTPGSFASVLNKAYLQYFSVLITLVSAGVAVAVSLATAKTDTAAIAGLTYGAANEADRAETRESWGYVDVAGSVVVLAPILGAYLCFCG
jgi:SSS family solute:Na+ symporter